MLSALFMRAKTAAVVEGGLCNVTKVPKPLKGVYLLQEVFMSLCVVAVKSPHQVQAIQLVFLRRSSCWLHTGSNKQNKWFSV
jgi:hypothetical protein